MVAYGSCQKAADPKLKGGEYCPWKDLDVTSWELSDDTFTAGAYRALDEFKLLKTGNAYSIISGYIIQDSEKIYAQLEPPIVNELIILDSISQAMRILAASTVFLAGLIL